MKFVANVSGLFVVLPMLLTPIYAANVCDCPAPPGGRIICEDHQFATCKVQDGKVYADCKTPPKSSSQGIQLRAWGLSEALQTRIEPSDVAKSKELQRILTEGRYINPDTKAAVTFRLPRGAT